MFSKFLIPILLIFWIILRANKAGASSDKIVFNSFFEFCRAEFGKILSNFLNYIKIDFGFKIELYFSTFSLYKLIKYSEKSFPFKFWIIFILVMGRIFSSKQRSVPLSKLYSNNVMARCCQSCFPIFFSSCPTLFAKFFISFLWMLKAHSIVGGEIDWFIINCSLILLLMPINATYKLSSLTFGSSLKMASVCISNNVVTFCKSGKYGIFLPQTGYRSSFIL